MCRVDSDFGGCLPSRTLDYHKVGGPRHGRFRPCCCSSHVASWAVVFGHASSPRACHPWAVLENSQPHLCFQRLNADRSQGVQGPRSCWTSRSCRTPVSRTFPCLPESLRAVRPFVEHRTGIAQSPGHLQSSLSSASSLKASRAQLFVPASPKLPAHGH